MTRIEAIELFVRAGQTVKLRAFGNSMTPAIASGDTLIVEAADATSLRVGEVVLCRAGRHLIAHRIASVAPGPIFLLSDDQIGREDGWFEASRILGRVSEIEHAGTRRRVVYHVLALAVRRLVAQLRVGVRDFVLSSP